MTPAETPDGERVLVLYVRAGCHLCRVMHQDLLGWRDRLGFGVEVVDVDASAELIERYDHKVPVLCEGEEEICHHFLDEDMLIAHLSGAA